MKKISFFIVAMLCLNRTEAQQIVDNICMQVIGCNGLSAEKNGRHYDATMGEVMVASLQSSDATTAITQGFHQPECGVVSTNNLDFDLSWQLEIFPNPTPDLLHIHYNNISPDGGTLNVRVWNIAGGLMYNWRAIPERGTLDCSSFASGIYLLELQNPATGQHATTRITKTTL